MVDDADKLIFDPRQALGFFILLFGEFELSFDQAFISKLEKDCTNEKNDGKKRKRMCKDRQFSADTMKKEMPYQVKQRGKAVDYKGNRCFIIIHVLDFVFKAVIDRINQYDQFYSFKNRKRKIKQEA